MCGMKHFELIAVALMCVLLWSCHSGDFTIEGEIKGLGTQNVRITYLADDGVATEVVTAEQGRFAFTGSSNRLTVVDIADAQGSSIIRAAAINGDRLTINGELEHPELIAVEGSEVNELWTQFRTEHSKLYARAAGSERDQAIEQWVGEHRQQATSALLLLFDHSAPLSPTAQQLLTAIAPEVRPDHLLAAVEALANYLSRGAASTMRTLTLCGTSGDFETLHADGHPMAIYCWSMADADRVAAFEACKHLAERGVVVADVLLDADTTGWAAKRQAASQLCHYWSPTGPMDESLKPLRIASVPWFIVADSTGNICYRGSSPQEALKALP